jgi:leucyl-tRNA synthetase
VLSPEHPLILKLTKNTPYEKEVKETIKKIQKQSIIERTTPEGKDKIGCFIGRYAINPANKEEIPIYIANFALMEYGTGAVMANAHDSRDFDFARKYNLPLKFVISQDGKPTDANTAAKAYTADGVLFDSGKFSGMRNREALPLMQEWLVKNKSAKKAVNYKFRDWLISRQRYWGTPIPVIYCKKCGIVTVPYEQLPVLLPKNVKFTGSGNPLATATDFVNTQCPRCGGKAKRETDTMDTFVDSSWYFFRYCSPKYDKLPFDKEKINYWMPVDQYIGGIEHAVMHLLYARFFTKALRDLGLHKIDEPFTRLLCQGMVLKDGAKMSKSLGNIVDPSEIMDKYGPDTARLFILFAALPEKELEWSDRGVEGVFKFLKRVYKLVEKPDQISLDKIEETKLSVRDKHVITKTHYTIKKVTSHIENFQYNAAIGAIMEYVNLLYRYKEKNKQVFGFAVQNLTLLLSPFAPHIAEELWEKIGKKGFVSTQKWPCYDETKIDKKTEAGEAMITLVRRDIRAVMALTNIKNPKTIQLILSPKWKYPLFKKIKAALQDTHNPSEIIKAVLDGKHNKEIANIVQRVVKDANIIPIEVLTQEEEKQTFEEYKKELEDEFKSKIEILSADFAKDKKATQAQPGKPAILLT